MTRHPSGAVDGGGRIVLSESLFLKRWPRRPGRCSWTSSARSRSSGSRHDRGEGQVDRRSGSLSSSTLRPTVRPRMKSCFGFCRPCSLSPGCCRSRPEICLARLGGRLARTLPADGHRGGPHPAAVGAAAVAARRARAAGSGAAGQAPNEAGALAPPAAEAKPPLVDVVINPGLGFGTGLHPTTRGTLLLLQEGIDRRAPARGPAPPRAAGPLVDVGTGSGILAIAAAKLGWAPVVALDNDPVALVRPGRTWWRTVCKVWSRSVR